MSSKRDNFIAIGHSFGARMLFAAVNAPFILDIAKAYPGSRNVAYKTIRGPADAVVLINPAFEAARYTTIDSVMRNEEVFSNQQPPLMITVSTDNDAATRTAFPFGQLLGLSFDEKAQTTLGNYKRFYTHSLLVSSGEACKGNDPLNLTEEYFTSGLCLRREPQWHRLSEEDRKRDRYGWSDVPPGSQRYNPFLVVHTTKEVINNHGGFWEEDKSVFSNWLFDILKTLDLRNDQAAGRRDK